MSVQFTNEKALEDFICSSEVFDDFLHEEFKDFDLIGIYRIGRQIYLGDFIIDLLYFCDVKEADKLVRYYIVVELKNVKAKPKDLCQLSRYTGILKDSFNKNDFFKDSNADIYKIKGYLVAPEFDQDLEDLLASHHLNEEIRFVEFCPEVTFKPHFIYWKDDFIHNLKLDESLINSSEEEE